MAFWTNTVRQIKITEMRNVDYVGADLSFRASPASVCFLVHARDVTAAYEAALMQNFTACNVGFLCMHKRQWESREKMAEGKMKPSVSCVCVCRGVREYILSGQRALSSLNINGLKICFSLRLLIISVGSNGGLYCLFITWCSISITLFVFVTFSDKLFCRPR